MWLNSVALPAPRKPDNTVTGSLVGRGASCMGGDASRYIGHFDDGDAVQLQRKHHGHFSIPRVATCSSWCRLRHNDVVVAVPQAIEAEVQRQCAGAGFGHMDLHRNGQCAIAQAVERTHAHVEL